jgi:hypothetical protein
MRRQGGRLGTFMPLLEAADRLVRHFLRLRRLQDVAAPQTRYLLGLLFRSVSSLL